MIVVVLVSVRTLARACQVKLSRGKDREIVNSYAPTVHPTRNSLAANKQPMLPGFRMKANECYSATSLPVSKEVEKFQVLSTVGVHDTGASRTVTPLTEDLQDNTRDSCMYEYVNPL